MSAKKQMKLGFIMEGPGNGYADWRHPQADPLAMIDFKWFVRHAQEAERGKFDFIFYADNVYVDHNSPPYMINRLEPLTLLAALAAHTKHIGLAATVSSTFAEPLNVARMFASLDHISGGRAGWNLVTSTAPDAAKNFSKDKLPSHDERYRMADDHLAAVRALWDSWEEGAMIGDKEAGVLFDPDKLHVINHKGPFYQVKGPLNLSRTPQGHPIVFQAGASEDGKSFAAKNADAIFVGFEDKEAGAAWRGDMRARAVGFGRNPDHVLVIPPIVPYVGVTEAQAEALHEERASRIDLNIGLTFLTKYFFHGHDLTVYDPDAPFPDIWRPEHFEGLQASIMKLMKKVKERNWTLRQAAQFAASPKGSFIGTPETIADKMQAWFEAGACDGFILNESSPEHLTVIVDRLIPELQRRGLVRTEYEGANFRENLGLPVPENRFTAARRGVKVA